MKHPITLENQLYICPSDAVNGDNIGKVHFLWSHQKFWNHYEGTSFTDASYSFEKVGGSEAFVIHSTTGELTVSNITLFTADTTVTIRVSVGGMHMDVVCSIMYIPAGDCIFIDPSYSGTSTGTRSQPYKKFKDAGLGNGIPGKTYLFKRGTTITRDWIRIVSPKVGGQYPAYINIGTYGEGARPIVNGSDNIDGLTNQRFITLGNQMNIDGSEPQEAANNVRIFDFETTLDNPTTNDWYPFEVKVLGDNFEFHRIKCTNVGLWEDGFFWLTGTTAAPVVDRNINLYNIETYENQFRAIKVETSGVRIYNYRGQSTLTQCGFPISFANKPIGAMKFLDVKLEDHEVSFGAQIRSYNQNYEWMYIEGANNPLVVYPLTNSYEVNSNNFFKNIILKDCKTRISQFGKGSGVTINANGIVLERIKAIDCEGSLEVAQGASNTKIAYCDLGTNGIILWASSGNNLDIHNTKTGLINIDPSKTGVNVVNTQYSSITGPRTLTTSTTSINPVDLIGLGTDLGYTHDLKGNAVVNPPSIGPYELYEIPVQEFTITVGSSGGGIATGGGVYEDGTQATLTATPNTGWHFVRWSNDVTDNPYSFTVTDDGTLQAIFAQDEPIPGVIIVKGKFRIV